MSFDTSGREFVCKYVAESKKTGLLEVGKCTRDSSHKGPNLHLGICLIKGSAFDYSLQKLTELGATHICPLTSERSQVRLNAERLSRKANHWQAVVTSAAEQCGRLTVPAITSPQTLESYLKTPTAEQKFILDPAAQTKMVEADPVDTALLIGPEGGFTEPEIALSLQHGYQRMRLGRSILRADTAGVAALAVLQQLMGWPD